jgi:hypothetical protein
LGLEKIPQSNGDQRRARPRSKPRRHLQDASGAARGVSEEGLPTWVVASDGGLRRT